MELKIDEKTPDAVIKYMVMKRDQFICQKCGLKEGG